jgi:hypothetical protein
VRDDLDDLIEESASMFSTDEDDITQDPAWVPEALKADLNGEADR